MSCGQAFFSFICLIFTSLAGGDVKISSHVMALPTVAQVSSQIPCKHQLCTGAGPGSPARVSPLTQRCPRTHCFLWGPSSVLLQFVLSLLLPWCVVSPARR